MTCTYLLNLGGAPAKTSSSAVGAADQAARQTWWQPRGYLGCLPSVASHTVEADTHDRRERRRPERYPYPVPGHLLPFQVATRCARTVKVMMSEVKILLGDLFFFAP